MELLLFWKDHWMDSWDSAKVDSLDPIQRRKYDARNQWGDVISIREDGYWAERGFDKAAFMVLKVPGLALDPDKATALYDGDRFIRKRKWFANRTKIPKNILDRIESQGRIVTVTETQFNNFIERKT